MTLRRLPNFLRLHLHRSPELQLQVADEGLNLLVLLRRDELGRLQEFLVPFIGLCRRRPEHVAQQPVGDIDMGIAVFLGGILLQDRRDGDSQLRILRELALPLIIAVDVRKGHNLAALQHQQPVVDLGFAAGGQPQEAGHEAGADYGRLLTLHQGHNLAGILPEQVLAEKALRELPVFRKTVGVLHQGVHPGYPAGALLILDAVASLGVVLHYLPGAAAAVDVQLEEDDVPFAGHAQLVVVDEALNDDGVKNGAKEGDEVGIPVRPDALEDDVWRDEAGGHGKRLGPLLFCLQPIDFLVAPVGARLLFRMELVEFPRGQMVAAGSCVVADSAGGVYLFSVVVKIAGEAVVPLAVGACVPGTPAAVFL